MKIIVIRDICRSSVNFLFDETAKWIKHELSIICQKCLEINNGIMWISTLRIHTISHVNLNTFNIIL